MDRQLDSQICSDVPFDVMKKSEEDIGLIYKQQHELQLLMAELRDRDKSDPFSRCLYLCLTTCSLTALCVSAWLLQGIE